MKKTHLERVPKDSQIGTVTVHLLGSVGAFLPQRRRWEGGCTWEKMRKSLNQFESSINLRFTWDKSLRESSNWNYKWRFDWENIELDGGKTGKIIRQTQDFSSHGSVLDGYDNL